MLLFADFFLCVCEMLDSKLVFVAIVVTVLSCTLPALAVHRPSFSKTFGHGLARRSPHNPRQFTFSGRPSGHRGAPQLDYNVTLRQGVHSLDEDGSVADVDCPAADTIIVGFDTTTVRSSTAAALRAEVAAWEFVAVGAEWACGNGSSVVARVLARDWLGASQVRLTVAAAELSDVFEDAAIHFSSLPAPEEKKDHPASEEVSHPAVPITEEEMLEKRRRRGGGRSGRLQGDDVVLERKKRWSLTVTNPKKGVVFWTGDTITVTWKASDRESDEYFNVRIKIDINMGTDTLVASKTHLSYTATSVNFTVGASWPSSRHYYAEVEWCNFLICFDDEDSQYFMVNPEIEVGLLPLDKPVYEVGDNVTIKWAFPESKASEYCWIKLWIRVDYYFDTEVSLRTRFLFGNGLNGVYITVDSTWEPSDRYYWELQWDCDSTGLWCGSFDYSEEFSIKTSTIDKEVSVEFLSPTQGASFFTGDTMRIEWSHTGLDFGENDITLYLKRDVLGSDPELWSQSYKISQDGLWYLDLTLWSSLSSSTQYYIKAEYDCGLLFCSTAETRRFSINYFPKFTLTGVPTKGTQIDVGTPLNLRWTASSLSSSTPIYVRLMKLYPTVIINFDKQYADNAERETTVGAGAWTYTPQDGTYFPVYFEFRYNCYIGSYFCTVERSNDFLIPESGNWNWNYDALTGGAINSPISFFDSSCTGCPDNDTETCPSTGLQRDLCSKSIDSVVQVTCEDCFITNTLEGTDFRLEISLGDVKAVRVLLAGKTNINLGIDMNIEASWTDDGEELLAFAVPGLGFSFSVAGIEFKLGVFAKLYGVYELHAEASAIASLSHVSEIEYSLDYQSGTTLPYHFDSSLSRTVSSTSFSAMGTAEAGLVVGFRPAIEFNVKMGKDIVNLSAWVQPQIEATARASIPPFAPTTNPLIPGTKWAFGDCTASHYLEGEANFSVIGSASAYAAFFGTKSIEFPLVDDICLASGCFLPSSLEPLEEVDLDFACASLGEIGLSTQEFEVLFTSEIARALGQSRVRFKTALTSESPLGLKLTILPSTDSLAPTSPELREIIEQNINNPSNPFYTIGWLGKQLNCFTISSSDNVDFVSSTGDSLASSTDDATSSFGENLASSTGEDDPSSSTADFVSSTGDDIASSSNNKEEEDVDSSSITAEHASGEAVSKSSLSGNDDEVDKSQRLPVGLLLPAVLIAAAPFFF